MFGIVGLVDRIDRREGSQGPYARLNLSMEGGEDRRVFFAPTDEPEEGSIPCLMEFIERGVVREGTRLLFHHLPDNNEWFRWKGYKDRYGLWKRGPAVSVNVDRLVPVYEAVPYCRLRGFITGRLGLEQVTSEGSMMGIVRHRILQRHWRLLWGELSAGQDGTRALQRAREGTQDFIHVLSKELKIPDLEAEAATTIATCEEISNEIMDWTGRDGYFCSEYSLMSPRFGLIGRADFVGVRKARRSEGRIIEYKITDNAVNFEHRKSWGSARALLQAGIYSEMLQEAVRLPRVDSEIWVFDRWTGSRAFRHGCEEGESEEHLRRSLWARDEYLFTTSSPRPVLDEYGKGRCSSCSMRDACRRLVSYAPDPELSRVRDGLDLEAEAGFRTLQPIEDLFEDGLVIPRNDIVEYDEDQLTVRIGRSENVHVSAGSFVRFSPIESTHGWGFGVIREVDGDIVQVSLRDPLTPSILAEGRLRLDFSIPIDFSKRAKMAITAIEMPGVLTDDPGVRSHLEDLRKAVKSAPSATGGSSECEFDGLNRSQMEAARTMMGSKLTLVHGPFGSGKTTVIARAALEMVRRGEKVLVTSYTNNAVDNALSMIAGLSREMGIPAKIARVATKSRAEETEGVNVVDSHNYGKGELGFLREADVVGSTLISCLSNAFRDAYLEKDGYVKLRSLHFDACIVDEASQCIMPFALIPCLLSKRWVLVGDHKQLEPLVLDQRAREVLDSWFDMAARDLEETGGITMLDVQYRCPHEVGSYLSRQFYESRLENDEVGDDHDHPPLSMDPGNLSSAVNERMKRAGIDANLSIEGASTIMDPASHLIYLDTEGRSRERGRRSKSNTGEAILASEVIGVMGEATEDLLFLSPYQAQNHLVRELCDGDIRMGTVDSYQGRQADVVVLSLVRSNTNGILGFLRNVRRLNVAMSRCMKKLIVISDSTTIRMNRADLQARDALMNYIHEAKKLGTYVSLAPSRGIGRSRAKRRGLAPKGSLSR